MAVPIGNSADISSRAVQTLQSVDVIACEDTRVTGQLLKELSISQKLLSYHNYSEDYKSEQVLALLSAGKDVALVSDAGTPLISDPGCVLIRKAREAGFQIIPIPGPSAVATVLSVSGMNANAFYFSGFLSKRESEIRQTIKHWKTFACTIVFFESPKRLRKTLALIHQECPNASVLIARELTKTYEQIESGAIPYVLERLADEIKGEIVVALELPSVPRDQVDPRYLSLIRRLASLGLSTKDLVSVFAEELHISKNQLKHFFQHHDD